VFGLGGGFGFGNGGFGLGGGGFGGGFGGFASSGPPGFATGFAPGVPFAANVPEDPAPAPVDGQPANEFSATLTIQFPASSQMWMGGRSVNVAEQNEHVLTSPPLQSGDSYTFDVKLRWSREGKTYEANRILTLAAGARSRLIIVSGEEVPN
jgi:uncharacterized protein (TIGR03000 family)